MIKVDIVNEVSKIADITKVKAEVAVDAVFDAMKEHLSDEAILEFTYITMMYTMHAVISRALCLEYDDREDPIVEIAAPVDYRAADVGRQIGIGGDENQ